MSELYPPTRTESLLSALAELVPLGIGASVKTLLVDSAHRQVNAIDLCYRTSFEQKRWRLAEALKHCVLDPSKINDAVVEQQVLRDVEQAHILVLNELGQITERFLQVSHEGYRNELSEYESAWKHYPAPITAVLGNSGLAKELPAYYTGGAEHTLVTEYGLRVLGDFRRLGMQLDVAARPRSSYS